MKAGLELATVVGLDDVDPERQAVDDVLEKAGSPSESRSKDGSRTATALTLIGRLQCCAQGELPDHHSGGRFSHYTVQAMRRSLIAFISFCLAAGTAQAAPIVITAGSSAWQGSLNVSGPEFSYYNLHGDSGLYEPNSLCGGASGCAPGTTLSLTMFSSDLQNGTATYQGITYTTGPGPLGTVHVSAGFSGSFTLPDVSGTDVTFIQPVSFQGAFHFADPLVLGPNSFANAFLSFTAIPNPLAGNPTAVYQGPMKWRFNSARYEISTVPEPTPLGLIAIGLAFAALFSCTGLASKLRS
jgi:hypothetical protein